MCYKRTVGLSEQGIKVLWGRSGGRCAKCRRLITEDDERGRAYPVGEQAHVVAKSRRGPRGDGDLTDSQRAQPENHILLCGSCHEFVDKARDQWPPERLLQLKLDHEEWVRQFGDHIPMHEIAGDVNVQAVDAEIVEGVAVEAPTRIKPGTRISVKANRATHVTGMRIGSPSESGYE
jgi:hypothetical protein